VCWIAQFVVGPRPARGGGGRSWSRGRARPAQPRCPRHTTVCSRTGPAAVVVQHHLEQLTINFVTDVRRTLLLQVGELATASLLQGVVVVLRGDARKLQGEGPPAARWNTLHATLRTVGRGLARHWINATSEQSLLRGQGDAGSRTCTKVWRALRRRGVGGGVGVTQQQWRSAVRTAATVFARVALPHLLRLRARRHRARPGYGSADDPAVPWIYAAAESAIRLPRLAWPGPPPPSVRFLARQALPDVGTDLERGVRAAHGALRGGCPSTRVRGPPLLNLIEAYEYD
jgi:hypothetical protein